MIRLMIAAGTQEMVDWFVVLNILIFSTIWDGWMMGQHFPEGVSPSTSNGWYYMRSSVASATTATAT